MRLVLCNCPPEVADEIGREVIDKGLAAYVNAVPGIKRTYRREDELCVQEETMLMIQTLTDRLQDLIDTIIKIHPSDLPAIISLSIYEGNESYMTWVEENLDKES
jgi:periplasmic divalent cation tolerance protein